MQEATETPKPIIDPIADAKLHDLLAIRRSIWEADKDLSARKEANSEALMKELATRNITSAIDEQYGQVTRVESTRNSLDQNKLKQELLRLGVATGVIMEAIGNATKATASVFIKYTPAKQ